MRHQLCSVGALLAEQHEKWITGSKYFDMEEYFEWKKNIRNYLK